MSLDQALLPPRVASSDADVDPTVITFLSECRLGLASLGLPTSISGTPQWVNHFRIKHCITCCGERFFNEHATWYTIPAQTRDSVSIVL